MMMKQVLIFNSGSSSLKCAWFVEDTARGRGSVRFTEGDATFEWRDAAGASSIESWPRMNHGDAAQRVLHWLRGRAESPAPAVRVGHRIVHGGPHHRTVTTLTAEIEADIARWGVLAPLHNPAALAVVAAVRGVMGNTTAQYAMFDTAYFRALPLAARTYALPPAWRENYQIERYGFHGIAHQAMYQHWQALTGATADARVITLQLGQGCSVTAHQYGAPLQTSMGYTPLEGLVMGTRSGDVDPGIMLELMRRGLSVAEIEAGITQHGGLRGLSGVSGDMRAVLSAAADGNSQAILAVEVFVQRVRHYLGAALTTLGGVDAILLGGGIAEHSPEIRTRVCAALSWCGVVLDADANQLSESGPRCISAMGSRTAVWLMSVDEEAAIAREVLACPT